MPTHIPGLTGIEHVGLTVPDLDLATRFFHGVLAAETLYDIGPFATPQDWMASHLAARPGARLSRMRVLRIGSGPVLELIEFAGEAAESRPVAGAAFHIALYVDDMDAALAAVRSWELPIQSGPVTMTEGPSAGSYGRKLVTAGIGKAAYRGVA